MAQKVIGYMRISTDKQDLEQPISYNSYKYFVEQDPELVAAWRAQRA